MHSKIVFINLFVLSVIYYSDGKVNTSTDKQPLAVSSKDVTNCVCTDQYEPVCGNDGKTYRNACLLLCTRRLKRYVAGVCHGECPCCKRPFWNDPSVPLEEPASDAGGFGQTQRGPPPFPFTKSDNLCEYNGPPAQGCTCTAQVAPVCGNNGKTYSNPCLLECQQKVEPCLKEACKGPCPCCSCTSTNST